MFLNKAKPLGGPGDIFLGFPLLPVDKASSSMRCTELELRGSRDVVLHLMLST